MAPFLPVRATSRSQRVRIGKQTVKTGTTTYVDLASQVETNGIKAGSSLPFSPFKELQNHLAIGAVFVAGPITGSSEDWVIVSGGATTATEAEESTYAVTAGELLQRSTGTHVTFALFEKEKVKTAIAGKERIDLLTIEDKAGATVTLTEGVAAAEGKAVQPATPAKSTVLAIVTTKNKNGKPVVTDLRPRP